MAKKVISFILFYLIVNNLNAQTNKNKWYLGASLSSNYVFAKVANSKGAWSTLLEAPTLGYFILDNFAINLGTSIHIPPKNIRTLLSTDIPYVYSLNPSLKYYFGQSKLKPYAQLQYRFGKESLGKYEVRINTGGFQTYQYINRVQVVQVSGGIAYFLTPKMSIDMGLYLDKSFRKAKENYPDNITGKPLIRKTEVNTNAGLRLGLFFHFK